MRLGTYIDTLEIENELLRDKVKKLEQEKAELESSMKGHIDSKEFWYNAYKENRDELGNMKVKIAELDEFLSTQEVDNATANKVIEIIK